MIDYKHQESTYVPFALEGDIRRWNRYKGKMMIRRIKKTPIPTMGTRIFQGKPAKMMTYIPAAKTSKAVPKSGCLAMSATGRANRIRATA